MWCTPHECDMPGAHRTHAIYVVYTARMRLTRCTPYQCSLCGVHRANETHSVHTVQIAQGRNLCGAHHTNEIYAVHTAQIVSAGQRIICKSSFAWCTPDRLPMAVPRQGTRVVIYVVLTAQMLPEEFAEYSGYDLYGPHHVNGSWASQHRRTHVVICAVYTAQIALRG